MTDDLPVSMAVLPMMEKSAGSASDDWKSAGRTSSDTQPAGLASGDTKPAGLANGEARPAGLAGRPVSNGHSYSSWYQ